MSQELLEGRWDETKEALLEGLSGSKRSSMSVILENTKKYLRENASSGSTVSGNIATLNRVILPVIRRVMPTVIANELVGVQPMTGPTGLIFAMRAKYSNSSNSGVESFYNEVNTAFASVVGGANTLGDKQVGTFPGNTTTGTSNLAATGIYNFGAGMSTAQAEALGTSGNVAFAEMAFSIEKVTVTAKSRALKAEYTMELAQDLKAIHGLDAETELSNILTSEILAEINREVVRSIIITAERGATEGTTTSGFFDLDTDSNGRWMVEKVKGLAFQIEREANTIAKTTRRGKGNVMICSSDVASALAMAGILDYNSALQSQVNLTVDDTGNTFAGTLFGRIKVYIDPYAPTSASSEYAVVGYKGSNAYDAGLFYCPYVPLQMVRAVDTNNFQPKIGFKTRYGLVANPFAEGTSQGNGALNVLSNNYYRAFKIANLM